MFSRFSLPFLTLLAVALEARAQAVTMSTFLGIKNVDFSLVDVATFSFTILFALCALAQACYAIVDIVKTRNPPREDYPHRVQLNIELAFMAILISTHYILQTTLVAFDLFSDPVSDSDPLRPRVLAFTGLTYRAANAAMFFYILLLNFYRRRGDVTESPQTSPPQGMTINGLAVIHLLLPSFLLGKCLGRSIVQVLQVVELKYFGGSVAAKRLLDVVWNSAEDYFVYYLFLSLFYIVSSCLLWNQVLEAPSETYATFDQNVLLPMVKVICPTLILLALREVIIFIIRSTMSTASLMRKYSEFRLADVLVTGILTLFILSTALNLGWLPKEKRDQETDLEASETIPLLLDDPEDDNTSPN